MTPRCPRAGRHFLGPDVVTPPGALKAHFIERGYRKNAEIYGILEG